MQRTRVLCSLFINLVRFMKMVVSALSARPTRTPVKAFSRDTVKLTDQDAANARNSLMVTLGRTSNKGDRTDSQHTDRNTRLRTFIIAILTLVVLLTVYLLRLDGVVGQFKDDAWYVVLAKSLATGRGYNLINYPQHSGMYFYPPLFPLLLSLLYRVYPEFPANVPLLKSLSIFSMLLVPVLVFRFFHKQDRLPRSLAYLVAFATAAAPSLVMLATSTVMSECVFMALQFATLLVAERCLCTDRNNSRMGILVGAALLASASYLTRSIGIVLIAAVAAKFLKEKMFKQLAVFCIAITVCIAPWAIYKHLRTHRAGDVPAVEGYSGQFWDRVAGSGVKVGAGDLPVRFWRQSTAIVGDAVGGILAPSLYRSANESGEEVVDMATVIHGVARGLSGEQFGAGISEGTMGVNREVQIISFCLSVFVFIGFVLSSRRGIGLMELVFSFSLITIVAWPWPPIRFLLPLLPFFLYYLLLGVAGIYGIFRSGFGASVAVDAWTASRIVMICILAFFLIDNAMYVAAKHQPSASSFHPDWLRTFNASREAAEWVRDHTSDAEVVTGENLPAIYLYSRRHVDACGPGDCAKKGIRYFVKTGDYALVPLPSETVFRTTCHGVEVLDMGAAENQLSLKKAGAALTTPESLARGSRGRESSFPF